MTRVTKSPAQCWQLMRRLVCCALICAWAFSVARAEVIPSSPAQYFNDYAAVVAPSVASQLNQKLENFERSTSSQIVVAVFPKMQTESSIEDYAQHIFEAWKPGQKKLNNGAILLVFVQDRKMRIQTGYGLEGALPDATCKRIISDEIAPHLKAGDFNRGLTAGVNAMIAAAQGEYKGSGKTVHDRASQNGSPDSFFIVAFVLFMILMTVINAIRRRGTAYGSNGRTSYGGGWYFDSGGSSSWGSGGGFSGGDSGGFSGGGGGSGGGGASGSW